MYFLLSLFYFTNYLSFFYAKFLFSDNFKSVVGNFDRVETITKGQIWDVQVGFKSFPYGA